MSTRIIYRIAIVLALACGTVSASLSAHHAFSAEFDATKPVTLTGTVTKFDLINPHSWIYLDVVDKDGKTTNWSVELGAPNALMRRGWRTDAVKVGAEIVVNGYLAKNGKPICNGRTVKLPDGKELFVGSSGTGAPGDPGPGK